MSCGTDVKTPHMVAASLGATSPNLAISPSPQDDGDGDDDLILLLDNDRWSYEARVGIERLIRPGLPPESLENIRQFFKKWVSYGLSGKPAARN